MDDMEQTKCPRCGRKSYSRFYGPCKPCRVALEKWARDAGDRARRRAEEILAESEQEFLAKMVDEIDYEDH